jgi:RimJ/RimL family protein N-acetyltransferase
MNHTNENILLRKTIPDDLPTLFTYQADDEAAYMAAFVNEKFKDKEAYLAKWNLLLTDETLNIYTIVLDNVIVGSISTWMLGDELQISYGIAKEYWNRGIVTAALQQFLTIMPLRPLYGRIAHDNIGSARVLTKCGFQKIGEDQYYAFARKQEITEIIFLLAI